MIRGSYTTLWGFRTRTQITLTSDIRQRQVPLAFKGRPQGYSPSPAASVKKDPAPGRADSFECAGAEHIGSPDSLFASAQGAWTQTSEKNRHHRGPNGFVLLIGA